MRRTPPACSDTIGEMVYSMDVDQQVHRARQIEFDKEADGDVLHAQQAAQVGRPRPGRGAARGRRRGHGQRPGAPGARGARRYPAQSHGATAPAPTSSWPGWPSSPAIPEEAIDGFQKTLATSKDPRLLSWSHIYLGRMLDLDCKRDEAVAEYKQALETRDGQQDTRLAAERGVKTAYAVKGHSCDEDADDADEAPGAKPAKPETVAPGQNGTQKPQ